jgi:KH domain
VTVSSADNPNFSDSPAAQALLRCCAHLLPSDKPHGKHAVRLLVPPWQVSIGGLARGQQIVPQLCCDKQALGAFLQVSPLMGRDECGLHELRRSTGADIQVYTPDGTHTARTADDIVVVSGTPEPCLDALARIATILRNRQVLIMLSPANWSQFVN